MGKNFTVVNKIINNTRDEIYNSKKLKNSLLIINFTIPNVLFNQYTRYLLPKD